LTDFHGNEAKKNFERKIPKWLTKKTELFKIANSPNIFAKISGIGP
jgi:hypothetical protein